MDKDLAITLANDVTRSVNIFITALKMDNTVLAQKALTNAEHELAALRRMLEEKSTLK